MINGASWGSNQQIWVLSSSEQAPSAAAIPAAGRQAGAGFYAGAAEYECICECAYHPELVGMVIHINEHLRLKGEHGCWNDLSVFTQYWSSSK